MTEHSCFERVLSFLEGLGKNRTETRVCEYKALTPTLVGRFLAATVTGERNEDDKHRHYYHPSTTHRHGCGEPVLGAPGESSSLLCDK